MQIKCILAIFKTYEIFIANVPHKLDETELKKMLTQFGQVESVKLVTDKETGKRKGFGFIEMPVRDQAKAAITALNEKEIYGRKLALSEAADKGHDELGNFRQPKREYRGSGKSEEIDGNKR